MNETDTKTIIKFFGALKNPKNLEEKYISNEDEKAAIVLNHYKEHENISFIDAANVCLVILSNKDLIYQALSFFGAENLLNRNDELYKIPTLDYTTTEKEVIKSKYSSEYLKIILELTKITDSLTIEMKNDYPIRISNSEIGITVILAPRVERE